MASPALLRVDPTHAVDLEDPFGCQYGGMPGEDRTLQMVRRLAVAEITFGIEDGTAEKQAREFRRRATLSRRASSPSIFDIPDPRVPEDEILLPASGPLQRTPSQRRKSTASIQPLISVLDPIPVSPPNASISQSLADINALDFKRSGALNYNSARLRQFFQDDLLNLGSGFGLDKKNGANTVGSARSLMKLLPTTGSMGLPMMRIGRSTEILTQYQTEFGPLGRSGKEIAQQLCVLDSELFRKIERSELASMEWSGSDKLVKAPNIVHATSFFNQVVFWIAREVLAVFDVRRRAQMLASIINLMKLLQKRDKATFDRVSELFSSENNNDVYRRRLAQAKAPMIPYLGVYLGDLTLSNEARKVEMMAGISRAQQLAEREAQLEIMLDEFERHQKSSEYAIVEDESVLEEIRQGLNDPNAQALNEAELYASSYAIEPRREQVSPAVEIRRRSTSEMPPGLHHDKTHEAPTKPDSDVDATSSLSNPDADRRRAFQIDPTDVPNLVVTSSDPTSICNSPPTVGLMAESFDAEADSCPTASEAAIDKVSSIMTAFTPDPLMTATLSIKRERDADGTRSSRRNWQPNVVQLFISHIVLQPAGRASVFTPTVPTSTAADSDDAPAHADAVQVKQKRWAGLFQTPTANTGTDTDFPPTTATDHLPAAAPSPPSSTSSPLLSRRRKTHSSERPRSLYADMMDALGGDRLHDVDAAVAWKIAKSGAASTASLPAAVERESKAETEAGSEAERVSKAATEVGRDSAGTESLASVTGGALDAGALTATGNGASSRRGSWLFGAGAFAPPSDAGSTAAADAGVGSASRRGSWLFGANAFASPSDLTQRSLQGNSAAAANLSASLRSLWPSLVSNAGGLMAGGGGAAAETLEPPWRVVASPADYTKSALVVRLEI
ncbi:RasGEF, partial [Irineochytrium annulatum]